MGTTLESICCSEAEESHSSLVPALGQSAVLLWKRIWQSHLREESLIWAHVFKGCSPPRRRKPGGRNYFVASGGSLMHGFLTPWGIGKQREWARLWPSEASSERPVLPARHHWFKKTEHQLWTKFSNWWTRVETFKSKPQPAWGMTVCMLIR